MNRVFHSASIDSVAWIASIAVTVAIYTIVGFEEWVRSGRSHASQ